ncbi:hypothetical protein LWI28_025104 [Acer negundo]|uniref:MLO-like protein n=1 Tax=Acer negundo TaxID=4023 RepID=A0AAD5JKK8_ACENE|nr:hypothetical protein LWI28_025104 [Acer negundo]
MAGAATGERSLKETPTWAVAFVCALFVILSILIEHGIQSLGKWFQKRQKKAMIEALEKIKAELMLLGFISLLLTVGSTLIYKICIPASYGQYMLPCKYKSDKSYDQDGDGGDKGGGGGGGDNERKLLFYAGDMTRRVLAADAGVGDYCSSKGKISLISQSGMHQLHIFIFVLAVFHVLYSVVTIALAKAKIHQDSGSLIKLPLSSVTLASPELLELDGLQFLGSVTKVDYLTMRHGFINMGSHMKKAIFEDQTAKAIKKWQKAAKEKRKLRKEGGIGGGGGGDRSNVNGSSPSPSQGGASPLYLLHNHQHRSNQSASDDIESVTASPTAAYLYNYPSDTELSEIELGDQPRNNHEDHHNNNNNHNFSFGKR